MKDCITSPGKPHPILGYRRKSYKNKVYYAHRLVWIFEYGEIPRGYEIHHKCGNKACSNIQHLELVTRKEHSSRHGPSGEALIHSQKIHCKNGHEFDGFDGRQRTCSVCSKEIKHRHYLANREKFREKSREWKRNHRLLTKKSS